MCGHWSVYQGRDVTFILLIQDLTSGGAEKQLLLIARGLTELGHKCLVITLAGGAVNRRMEGLLERAKKQGILILRPTSSRLQLVQQSMRLIARLAEVRNAVVWSWGLRATLLAKVLVIPFPDARLVCSIREASAERMARYRRLERFRCARVRLYVNNSQLSVDLLSSAIGDAAKRSTVLWNSLDDDESGMKPVEQREEISHVSIAMLGNVKPMKGYDVAIQVAEELRAKQIAATIHIAGRDDMHGWLQRNIEARQLTRHICYEGETSSPSTFLRGKNAFLLLSCYEGMPNALIEAMNLGLPCIATRVGEVGRLEQMGAGLVVLGSPLLPSVISAIEDLLHNWASALARGRAARAFCQKFLTREALCHKLNGICAELA